MGPLVPDIIGPEFNLVIALLVGIGFGFALEQAGFSSTKKLGLSESLPLPRPKKN